MTDFVGRILRPERDDWIIRSLMDVDFYKFTMGQFIFRYYRGIPVVSRLINRHAHIPIADIVDEEELRAQLDHVRTLRFRRTDLYYLRGQNVYQDNMFSEDYLAFLERLQLPPYELRRVGDQYDLRFPGPWEEQLWWETLGMAIISELLYRTLMRSMTPMELDILFSRAKDRAYGKVRRIKTRPRIAFADFGQRRRFSFLWQQFVVRMAVEELGSAQFTGTSNTWMAFNQDLVPIGTNAHELPMVLTAIAPDDEKRLAQYNVLRQWQALFPNGGMRIVLPDTYGSAQFWNGMPKDLADEVAATWRGQRQDSGDPVEESLRFASWLQKHGVDPIAENRVSIASDGLDVDEMFRIDDALQGVIGHPYGWGTKFTNDFEGLHPRPDDRPVIRGKQIPLTNGELFRGHSIVCKVVSANGHPAVKLSNNVNKATGPADEVRKYLELFGEQGRVSQLVTV